jgi:DNA-binding NarL/FixJ family response regulator
MSIRVLLVDDHQMLCEGLRALLEPEPDIEVVGVASHGREALRMARQLGPDLVVMDIGMAEMNGVEATRELRGQDPQCRVVMLSTYSDSRYVFAALAAGARGYVLKIDAHEELLRAIRSVMRGGNYLSPGITELVVQAGLNAAEGVRSLADQLLSAREREVLQLVAEGRTSSEIATRLHVSTRTVESHRHNLMEKLGLHSVAELTKFAVREGLTTLEL